MGKAMDGGLVSLCLFLALASVGGTSQERQMDALHQLKKARKEGKVDTRSWGFDIDSKFHPLNGGPRCSSLGYGTMEELGPFKVASDGRTLYRNKYAWNKEANVLFLESPAEMDFSYSNTTADYSSNGDQHIALDNYAFLENWLERIPKNKERDFCILRENYAGHYESQLAHSIHLKQQMFQQNNHHRLQGGRSEKLRLAKD